jgi:hypothetical protein
MAGLVPAIHAQRPEESAPRLSQSGAACVHGRDKRGHDDNVLYARYFAGANFIETPFMQ